MRSLLAAALSLLALPAVAADAAKPAVTLTPTQEIFVAYELLCVKSRGRLQEAKPTIAKLEQSNTIKALPPAEAEKLFKKGDAVWATKTTGTEMFVVYDPIGLCALHIRQADQKAMKDEFVHYISNVNKGMKGSVLVKKADDKKSGDSLFSYYIITKPGAKNGAGFGLSTSAPEARKSPQHLLTFNLAKPE